MGSAARPAVERLDPPVDDALFAAHPFLETVVRGPREPRLSPSLNAPRSPAPVGLGRHGEALWELNLARYSTLRPEVEFLFLVGVISLFGIPAARGALLLSLAGIHLVVLYSLTLEVGYVSRRHLLPVVALALGYVGVGAPLVGGWIARAALWVTGRRRAAPAWLASALGAALLVGVAAPKALQPRRLERLAERRAAEWLRAQPDRAGAVAAPRVRVAYYADAAFVPLPPDEGPPLLPYLRAADARYMIVDDHHLDRHPAVGEAARDAMRVVHRVEAGGRSAAVFAIERAH